jgi:hypothetical protein
MAPNGATITPNISLASGNENANGSGNASEMKVQVVK